jgi:hypothetical protein
VDSLAIDGRSELFRDRIYLAWTDERSGHARIYFSSSSDRGLTWTKPRAIDDVSPALARRTDNFMPTLAVNKDGVVGITWNDRRDAPDGIGWTTRFTASLDGGETWLPSVAVSERPARFTEGVAGEDVGGYVEEAPFADGPLTLHVVLSGGPMAGDTAGLSADANGVFHAVWIDNRSGRGQIYTSPVTVAGTVARHGSADLAALADVSGRVSVDLSQIAYDAKTGRLTVEAAARNRSSEPLRGRLVGRILSVSSEAGRAFVLDADNGLAGAGAVVDFSALVPSGGLQPKQSTRARTLRFRIEDAKTPPLDPKEPWKSLRQPFLDLDIQFLGEPPQDAPKKEKP